MATRLRLSLCVFLLAATFPAIAADAPPEPGDVIHLFNGQNLSNFYTFLKDRGRDSDPKGVFSVRDGLLRISGEEWGCITTTDEFSEYHLVAEWKWGGGTYAPREDRARDSGILIHSVGEDGAYSGVWMHSIECQIIEGGTGDFIVVGDGSDAFSLTSPVAPEQVEGCYVYQPEGNRVTVNSGRINWFARDHAWKDERNFRGEKDIEHPVGEWNRLECIVRDGRITVLLNGVVVNEAFDVRPTAGRIQIQSEGAEIIFRRIDLLPVMETNMASPARQRRFIYNSDGDNMLIYVDPPMTPEKLFPYIDEIAESQVTTLSISPNVGMTVNYPSTVSDTLGSNASPALAAGLENPAATAPKSTERAAVNIKSLVDAKRDPLALIIGRAKERNLEVFASWRLNEVHAVEQEDSLIFSEFWKAHPEWRLGKAGDPVAPIYTEILGPDTHPIVASWLRGGLNFGVPEVRDHVLNQLRDLCERYNIDGLELDFQRFPIYFPQGEEQDYIPAMTEWMRQVRAMTNEVGERRRRPLLLSARVMARPEQNTAIGLDPISWAHEGLVDFLIQSHYLRNDFPLPVQDYRRLLPSDMPLYASIEVAPDADTYRRIASELWAAGADGIMLFNFFTTRERGKEPPFELLDEIGRPKQ